MAKAVTAELRLILGCQDLANVIVKDSCSQTGQLCCKAGV